MLFVAFVVLIIVSLADVIPTNSMTATRMAGICVRMNLYIQQHGQPPPYLADLPAREGYDNSMEDGWRHEIRYAYEPEKRRVRLTSYGRDGKPGGQKENSDFTLEITLEDQGLIPLSSMDFSPLFDQNDCQ